MGPNRGEALSETQTLDGNGAIEGDPMRPDIFSFQGHLHRLRFLHILGLIVLDQRAGRSYRFRDGMPCNRRCFGVCIIYQCSSHAFRHKRPRLRSLWSYLCRRWWNHCPRHEDSTHIRHRYRIVGRNIGIRNCKRRHGSNNRSRKRDHHTNRILARSILNFFSW